MLSAPLFLLVVVFIGWIMFMLQKGSGSQGQSSPTQSSQSSPSQSSPLEQPPYLQESTPKAHPGPVLRPGDVFTTSAGSDSDRLYSPNRQYYMDLSRQAVLRVRRVGVDGEPKTVWRLPFPDPPKPPGTYRLVFGEDGNLCVEGITCTFGRKCLEYMQCPKGEYTTGVTDDGTLVLYLDGNVIARSVTPDSFVAI